MAPGVRLGSLGFLRGTVSLNPTLHVICQRVRQFAGRKDAVAAEDPLGIETFASSPSYRIS